MWYSPHPYTLNIQYIPCFVKQKITIPTKDIHYNIEKSTAKVNLTVLYYYIKNVHSVRLWHPCDGNVLELLCILIK